MFVNAPRRSTNGNTSESKNRVEALATSSRPSTLAAAIAMLSAPNRSQITLSGVTTRQFMQRGRTGPGRFRNTSYAASYASFKSTGQVQMVYQEGSNRFVPLSRPLGYGYSGFYSSGLVDVTSDVNPNGLSSSYVALYNRVVIANLVNRVTAEARNKAANQRLDLSESLRDIDKTILLVASRSSQVLKAWNAIRKGNWEAALRNLGLNTRSRPRSKDLASLWLELQYGWRPLIGDVSDGMDVIKNLLDPTHNPQQFYAIRRGEEGLLLGNPGINSQYLNPIITNDARATVEVKLRFSVGDPTWAYLNSLSVLNPAYFAWVGLPFSFVVDWFLPVGDMLNAVTAPIGLKFHSGYRTTRAWADQEVSCTEISGNNAVYKAGQAKASASRAYIDRNAFTEFPGFFPYVRIPSTSPERVASAIALIETSKKFR